MKTETLQNKLEKKAENKYEELKRSAIQAIQNNRVLKSIVTEYKNDKGSCIEIKLADLIWYHSDCNIMNEVKNELLPQITKEVIEDFMQSVEDARNAIEDLNNY